MRPLRAAGVLAVPCLLLAACGPGEVTALPGDDAVSGSVSELELAAGQACRQPGGRLGGALAGLSTALQARFRRGLEEFTTEETPEEGLGPVFNDRACGNCHLLGAVGGASAKVETRAGRRNPDGSFDDLVDRGGSVIQSQGIATAAGCVQPPETVPAEANVVTGRLTTPLFGLGLLEAVPEATLRALEDPEDRDGDGVSGRVNLVADPLTGGTAVGRFGWKAQVASLVVFAGDAYLNEMGITTTLFPRESAPGGGSPVCDDGIAGIDDEDADGDGVSDGLVAFTDFMRLLGPPPTAGRLTDQVQRGASTFARLGCATCHRPALRTAAASDVPQLAGRTIYPFTDLLLHDMGRLGDGISQGQAGGAEMRTAPLWGLRLRGPFLHDGRAATVGDAILAHDGEAARARDAFRALSDSRKAELLAFLGFI